MSPRNVMSQYGVGTATPGEGTFVHYPFGQGLKRDGSQRFIKILHGHGGTAAAQSAAYLSMNGHMANLVRFGWIAGAGDFGGVAPWANDTALSSMTDLYTYATGNAFVGGQAQLNCLPQIDMMGWSMGGLGTFNFIKRNASLGRIHRVVTWAPALQITYFHDGNYGAEVEAAYGGAANWQANIVGHEPLNEIATYKQILEDNDIHVRIYHGTADTTAPIEDSRAFVSGINSPNITLTELPGYDHVNLFGGVKTSSIADFLWGKVPA